MPWRERNAKEYRQYSEIENETRETKDGLYYINGQTRELGYATGLLPFILYKNTKF